MKTVTGMRQTGLALAVASVALMSETAIAQVGNGEQDELEALRRQVGELQAREAAANQRVDELEARLERIESARVTEDQAADMRGRYVQSPARALADDPALAYFQGASPAVTQGGTLPAEGPGTSAADAVEPDRKTPAPTVAITDVTEERQGRFGDRIGFDLGANYTHFDSSRINLNGFLALDAIFLGTISIDQLVADIYTFDPTFRLGLGDRLFFDVNMPYMYRSSNFRSGGAGGNASGLVEKTVHDDGIGDLNAGASYRVFRETAGRPDIVINARVKAPTGRHPYGIELEEVEGSEGNLSVPGRLSTGSGVWGASLGVSALKTLDPMVVFGSVTYFRNFDRNFGDIDETPGEQPGRVSVGNAFQFGAGVAYALNDRSSISMSYSQRIVAHTRVRLVDQPWHKIVGSQANVAMMNLGATFALSRKASLITTIGMGLTDDSPDMAIGVRIPIRF